MPKTSKIINNCNKNVDKLDFKMPEELEYPHEKVIPICNTSRKIRIVARSELKIELNAFL